MSKVIVVGRIRSQHTNNQRNTISITESYDNVVMSAILGEGEIASEIWPTVQL